MILLIGGAGSIGRRYRAVLKHLGAEFRVIEAGDPIYPEEGDRAIICTPTDTHFQIMSILARTNTPFLCEKPLSKDIESLKYFHKTYPKYPGYLVNNYYLCLLNNCLSDGLYSMEWDFYNSGKDGLVWDVSQLVGVAMRGKITLRVRTESPIWTLKMNNQTIPYFEIEKSYITMISSFLRGDYGRLDDIAGGIEIAEKCLELEKRIEGDYEGFVWNPSADTLTATA